LAKKKKPVLKRAPTAGERAKWQKHKRRQRLIFIMGVLVIVAVLALLGYGYYDRVYQPDHAEANKLHKTVIQVNESKVSLEYVIDMTRFYNWLLQQQQQQQSTLQSYTIDDVAKQIEYHELLRQAAPELGIALKEGELETQLKSFVLPKDAPEDLTEAQYLKYYRETLKARQVSDKEFRDWVTANLLLPKLQDYLKAQVPKSAEQVHVQGVLVEKSMATEVADRLVFTGDSLDTVAKGVSLYTASKDNGADLGWLPRGIMGTKFDEAIFALEPGVLSQPIDDETGQKAGGVWMVSVLEKVPDRAIDDAQAPSLANKAFNDWFPQRLQQGLNSGQVVVTLNDAIRTWATQYVAEHQKTQ